MAQWSVQRSGGWTDYVPADNALLERLWAASGGRGTTAPQTLSFPGASGSTHTFDFSAMTQTTDDSATVRAMRRQTPGSAPAAAGAAPPLWSVWKGTEAEGRFVRIGDEDARTIERLWKERGGQGTTVPVRLTHKPTASYVYDFTAMVQRNEESGTSRKLHRGPLPDDGGGAAGAAPGTPPTGGHSDPKGDGAGVAWEVWREGEGRFESLCRRDTEMVEKHWKRLAGAGRTAPLQMSTGSFVFDFTEMKRIRGGGKERRVRRRGPDEGAAAAAAGCGEAERVMWCCDAKGDGMLLPLAAADSTRVERLCRDWTPGSSAGPISLSHSVVHEYLMDFTRGKMTQTNSRTKVSRELRRLRLGDAEREGVCAVCCERACCVRWGPDCSCSICFPCAQSTVQMYVEERRFWEKGEGYSMQCPCDQPVDWESMQRLSRTDDFATIEHLVLNWSISADEEAVHCKRPGCSNVQLHVDKQRYPLMVCAECGFKNCAVCDVKWHSGESCVEYQARRRAAEATSEADLDKISKKCPGCGTRCEKKGADEGPAGHGCDIVVCGMKTCAMKFCWVCLCDMALVLKHDNSYHKPGCKFHSLAPHAPRAPDGGDF
eukprot:TRINITY_DN4105_c1_g1_i4.p2 TRINITY_DN4105_c1_g1~~TRINITY_DN4105_c1_g1_i4.p2  ORF type:complete len:623 (+),score=183.78 TRINITY_DN4105_c1_g1_i4:69-1871(+)